MKNFWMHIHSVKQDFPIGSKFIFDSCEYTVNEHRFGHRIKMQSTEPRMYLVAKIPNSLAYFDPDLCIKEFVVNFCNWIVTSPKISSIYDPRFCGFAPTSCEEFVSCEEIKKE